MEEEIHRLRERLREVSGHDHDPPAWFNPVEFRKVLGRSTLWGQLGMAAVMIFAFVITMAPTGLRGVWLGPVPLVDFGGMANRTYGVGMGVIAVGGLAIGVIACGGGADEDAAMFFRRWIPSLERAITRPMQVVMAEAVPERL